MEYQMRRKNREITYEEAMRILRDGAHGIMATISEDKQLYGVPLSYAIDDKYIYFHAAKTGHKLDNIAFNNNVSFSVVEQGEPIFKDGKFSTFFASAIVFGKAEIVDNEEEKVYGLRLLCEKYLPQHMDSFDAAIEMSGKITNVVKISIDRVSGKAKKAM